MVCFPSLKQAPGFWVFSTNEKAAGKNCVLLKWHENPEKNVKNFFIRPFLSPKKPHFQSVAKRETLCCEKIRNFLWCEIGTPPPLPRLCHPVFNVLPEDYFCALLPFESWGDHNISLFNSKQRSAYLVLFLLNILTHYPACCSTEE